MLYKLPDKNSTRSNPPIIAELIGSETCTGEGLTACGDQPVFELCRLLLGYGFHPDRTLLVYRGETLALVITGIGFGAQLQVNGKGTGFAERPAPVRIGPLIGKSTVRVIGARLQLRGGHDNT